MNAHTPGPWTIGCDESQHCQIPILTHDGEDVIALAMWADGYPPGERGEANARLIAAAPDLLEACKDLLATCTVNLDDQEPDDLNAYTRANAAIAKAEGR